MVRVATAPGPRNGVRVFRRFREIHYNRVDHLHGQANKGDRLTFEQLQRETEPHINTLVVMNFKVVLLLGVVEDDEDWYYKVCENLSMGNDRHYLASCVMGFIYLKGRIATDEYDRMVHIWNLNSATQI